MRPFTKIEELTTENILMVANKCEYEICTEAFEGDKTGLQDAGCLEQFLIDAKVDFIDTDDTHYYYTLGAIKFKVPYETVEEWCGGDETIPCAYLLFDDLAVI